MTDTTDTRRELEALLNVNARTAEQFEYDNGYTQEEMKIFWETQKIMEDPSIRVNATAVRVGVYVGHSEAVHIETASMAKAS